MTQQGIARRGVLVGAGSLLATPAIVRAQGQNGVALVIGNSKYHWESSLPNVPRDVADIAKRFEQLGLKTEMLRDLGRDALRSAIEKFRDASRGSRLAAFYFAGHGVFWEKQTYIVPVDADLSNPSTATSLITVRSINEAMKDSSARLLVFDSCRNNPADGWRQREAKALARGDAIDNAASTARQPNTLLLFSTAPGGIAIDGPPGENSPFATGLLRQLAEQSIDLQSLAAKLRRDLLLATECRQMVWDQSTFAAPLLINGRAGSGLGVRYDPSRIIELPNAYAFAAGNGLVLPPGLVAYRAAGTSKASVGSYKHDTPVIGGTFAPSVTIVMSIPDAASAEIIQSFKNHEADAGGTRWRNIAAASSEDRVTWYTTGGERRQELKWRDPNSGTYSNIAASGGGRTIIFPFSRLDG